MAQGTLVNVAAYVYTPDKVGTRYDGKMVEPRSQEELLQRFSGWEDEVLDVLKVRHLPSHRSGII